MPGPGPGGNVSLPDQKTSMTTIGRADMNRAQAAPEELFTAVSGAPLAIELRHLRYFVALADAGSFTRAAERMFIAQPTLRRGTISLGELARMDVIHGPRRTAPGTYDAWTRVLRTVDPRFEFSDPPLRHSLQMDLAFAATADRPTAVLTGPSVIAGSRPALAWLPRPTVAHDMVPVGLEHHPLTATAAVVWSSDLSRPLQQVLFDTADSVIF